MIYLLSVMGMKNFGLRLKQDRKPKTFYVSVLTDTRISILRALLRTWIKHSKNLEKSNVTIFMFWMILINLLKYDGHTVINDFINSMVSYYLLHYILHTTRVTLPQ